MAQPRSVPQRAAGPVLLLLLLFFAMSLAQPLPSLQLDSTSYEVGDEVTLDATSLTAGEEYLLRIEDPSGEVIEETLTASDQGAATHTFTVDEAGDWTLRLRGEDLNASLTVRAEGPPPEQDGDSQTAQAEEADPDEERSDERTAPAGAATQETVDEQVDGQDDEQGDEAGAQAQAEDADEPAGPAGDERAESSDTTAGQATEPQEAGVAEQEEDSPEEQEEEPTTESPREGEAAEGQQDESTIDEQEGTATEGGRTDAETETEEELTFSTDGDAVVAVRGDSRVWRFDFPDDSGSTGAVLETGEGIWIGHGNSLILVDRETGVAQVRYPMPGRVIRLEPTGDGVSAVSDVDGNLRQRIEVDDEGPRSTVRFGIDSDTFSWLRNEAGVPDPAARLEIDPTNPWLHLRVGLLTDDQERLEEAVERGRTFFDLAGIAQELFEAGYTELATEAMDSALADFARRDYAPELLTSAELHRAYNFPLEPMEEALDSADLDAAEFWAAWLHLVSSEEAPQTTAALEEYSRQLAAVGQRDAASLWRERASADASSSPAASLDRFFLGLGRAGWYGVAALLAAILALHLTLTAKYWAPQSLAIRRSRETGSGKRPWSRLFAIRYYSFTEKLVLVLLFAAVLTLLGLTRWYESAGDRPAALASGTLASPVARNVVSSSPLEGQRADFIEGYAAHVAGEEPTARDEYLSAGDYPPALNNLAAISGNDVLYQRALELAPGMPEASFNLGRATDPSPFHARYLAGEPLLAVPDGADFRTAISGSWQAAVGTTFENPWRALRGMDFFSLPQVLWQILLALFLLWVLVTVIWLFIPRPSLARNAPRTGVYHLLALLVPGSGLADEAWGVLLMVPWALLGVDALAQWLGWDRSLGLPLETELWALAAIYVVNLIAFVVEYVSYRRRMRELRRRHPEAVEAYGLS